MSDSAHILTPSLEAYEQMRTRCFNGRVPDRKRAEIVVPKTTAEVADALKRAKRLGLKVGVQSGGHHFPCGSLKDGGLLLDLKDLNRNFEYDSVTKFISLVLAIQSKMYLPLSDHISASCLTAIRVQSVLVGFTWPAVKVALSEAGDIPAIDGLLNSK
jgi:hypothetical protein